MAIKTTTKTLEEIGFDSVALFDHFHTDPHPTKYPVFECWTLMAALAEVTSKIKLTQLVTCNSYRQPTYLAKISSVVDVISDGRLELGIGAGWYAHEYLGFGYEFPKASARIGMLEEAVQIIESMWVDEETNFEGKYYRVKGALNYPKPIQKPHPPIMIGGGGEKLTLRVVAKYADIWNWGVLEPKEYLHKLEVLKNHCSKVNRDYNSIEKSYTGDIFIADSNEQAEELVKDWKKRQGKILGEQVEFDLLDYKKRNPVGSPIQILDYLKRLKNMGVTYFIMYMPTATNRKFLELLYDEVVKPLKTN